MSDSPSGQNFVVRWRLSGLDRVVSFSKMCYSTNYSKFSSLPRVMDQINHLPSDFDLFNTNTVEWKRDRVLTIFSITITINILVFYFCNFALY